MTGGREVARVAATYIGFGIKLGKLRRLTTKSEKLAHAY